MQEYLYVKVYLYAYPRLQALEEGISACVENKALLSFRGGTDALVLMERLAEEIAAAKRLALLRAALGGVLERLCDEERFLLEYKYFRRKEELSKSDGVFAFSERSYFRKQNALLGKVAAALIRLGYTERDFYAQFGGFAPFMRVLRALKEGKERRLVWKRKRRGVEFQKSSAGAGAGRFPLRTMAAIAATASPAAQITTICNAEGEEPVSSGGGASPEEGLR